jgi:type VI secretion system secreted protein VgrG
MKPEAGTTVSLVAPPSPAEAAAAVESTAGQVEEFTREAATKESGEVAATEVGGSGSGEESSSDSGGGGEETAHEPDKEKKGWIEVLLKDEEGTPQGGARYKVTLPDGSVADGTLDDKGKARVDGFDTGQCKVEFPDLDEKVWS